MRHPASTEQPPLPRESQLAVALATLSVIGFSLVLLFWQLSLEPASRAAFLFENRLGHEPRRWLMAWLGLGLFVPLLVGIGVRLYQGPRSERALHRIATLWSPLCLAMWVPTLFDWRAAQDKPTIYLLVLSLFAFAGRALLTRSLEMLRAARLQADAVPGLRAQLPNWLGLSLVTLAGLLYVVFAAYSTISNHRQLATSAFDLGLYDNLSYNALHGRFFHSPVLFGPGNRSFIAAHAELAMLLFVPFYAIRPSAETLLVLQSVMLGMACIPLYLFAARLISRVGAVVLSLAYLLFAPLHGPNFSDFHWLPIAIFFHFWLYYAIAARKTWLIVASVLVLFALREDVALGIALLGVFLFVTGVRTRLGTVLAISGAVWFALVEFVLMPRMGAWWFESAHAGLLADGRASYGTAITTLLSNPVSALSNFMRQSKLEYAFHMVAPLAFLPLRRAPFLLLLIPGAAFTLVATGYWPTTVPSFQYTAHWIPYLFLACVLGLARLRYERAAESKFRAAIAVLAFCVVSHSYNFGAILQQESSARGGSKTLLQANEATQRYQQLRSLIRRIPQSASVASTEAVSPHVSSRLDAHVFRYDFGPVDYMLFSRNELSGDSRKVLAEQLGKVSYRLVQRAGEFYLLQRGVGDAATSAAMRELGLPESRPARQADGL